jgi:ABC-type oligopeptide transport system ATPase subunit
MSDQIAVMQSGKIVETGPAEEVYTRPVHEYTNSLLTSVPIPDPREMEARKVERRRARAALAAG